jgi:hypothetical protein
MKTALTKFCVFADLTILPMQSKNIRMLETERFSCKQCSTGKQKITFKIWNKKNTAESQCPTIVLFLVKLKSKVNLTVFLNISWI